MKNGGIERCSIKKTFVNVTFLVRICIVSLRHTMIDKIFLGTSSNVVSIFSNFFFLLFNVDETTNRYHGYLWRESSARKITAKKEDRGCIDGFPPSSWFLQWLFRGYEQVPCRANNCEYEHRCSSVFLKVLSGDVYWKRDNGEHVTLLKI